MPLINKTLDVILNKYNNYAGLMDNVREMCVNYPPPIEAGACEEQAIVD